MNDLRGEGRGGPDERRDVAPEDPRPFPEPLWFKVGWHEVTHVDRDVRMVMLLRCDTCLQWFGVSAVGRANFRDAVLDWPGWDIWNGSNGPEQNCPDCVARKKGLTPGG